MSGRQPLKRKSLTLEMKLEVIKKKEQGWGNTKIGRAMGLRESTVRTILKQKEQIEKLKKSYGASKVDERKRKTSAEIVAMERYLSIWINRKESEGVPLDKKSIMEQAKIFYVMICKKNGVAPSAFKASSGWLYRFLRRKGIRNVRLTGEGHSADEVAAQQFPEYLKEVIQEEGYHPDAIYNCDEAGLFYKRMPKSTFVAKKVKQARGRKADKTRITVMFCVNASGSHKMKPLVIHTARHPRSFNHLSDMRDAPVYWRASPKGWMRGTVMTEWFQSCFIPDARRRCRQDGREFKVLLTMDNCPSHPSFLNGLDPNVQVVFLPPNTTSLIQPLDQEIIACVKARYHMTVFQELRNSTASQQDIRLLVGDGDEEIDDPARQEDDMLDDPDEEATEDVVTVQKFWKAFQVRHAVDHLVAAWENINVRTIRHAWKKMTPHLITDDPDDSTETRQVADEELADAVREARSVPGFASVTAEELLEVQAEGEEASPEEIMGSSEIEDTLHEERTEQRVEEGEEDSDARGELGLKNISNILASVEGVRHAVRDNEISNVRITEILQGLEELFKYYTELHAEKLLKRKQSLITRFFRPVSPGTPEREEEPRPGTSRDEDDPPGALPEMFTDDDIEDFEGFMMEVTRAGTPSPETTPEGGESQ